MKRITILLFVTAVAFAGTSFRKAEKAGEGESLVKWYTIEEAVKLCKKEPRKIFMDVYTGWCGWCKVMDKNTFNNPTIAAYMNKNYYPVKFDAETRDTINFNGQQFINDGPPGRGTHQFAAVVLQNRLSYPSFVFIDEKQLNFTIMQGYHKPEEFEPYLHYYAEDRQKTMDYPSYLKIFKSELPK